MGTQSNAETTLVSMPEASRQVQKSKVTIYREIKAGTFPRPVRTGPKSIAFVQAELDAWVRERIADRDAAANDAEVSA